MTSDTWCVAGLQQPHLVTLQPIRIHVHSSIQTCGVLLGCNNCLWSHCSLSEFMCTAHTVFSVQVVVLYVEQEESVRRQMMRAQLASLHNQCAALFVLPVPHSPSWQPAVHLAEHLLCTPQSTEQGVRPDTLYAGAGACWTQAQATSGSCAAQTSTSPSAGGATRCSRRALGGAAACSHDRAPWRCVPSEALPWRPGVPTAHMRHSTATVVQYRKHARKGLRQLGAARSNTTRRCCA